MKILQISKSDKSGGGASRVAEQLHLEMKNLGHDSQLLVRHHCNNNTATAEPIIKNRASFLIERKMQTILRLAGTPNLLPTEYIWLKNYIDDGVDLAHFHDLSSAISPLSLTLAATQVPVVLTLHDCSPITGGCLYPLHCENYLSQCGQCPQLGIWPLNTKIDATKVMHRIKHWVHSRANIFYISPSQWLAKFVANSGIIKTVPIVIPNGVDTKKFAPNGPKRLTRQALNIPCESPVILLTAGQLNDKRKGIEISIEAINALRPEFNPFILLIGKECQTLTSKLSGLKFMSTGYITDDEHLSALYSSADVYLNCTLAENHPLSAIECLSSGTPIIGFKTGGLPEIVKENICGTLVSYSNKADLISALSKFLRGEIGKTWQHTSRQYVLDHLTLDRHIELHSKLYQDLIFKNSSQR